MAFYYAKRVVETTIVPIAMFDLTTTRISTQEKDSEIALKNHTINMQRKEIGKMQKQIKQEHPSAEETHKVMVVEVPSEPEMEMEMQPTQAKEYGNSNAVRSILPYVRCNWQQNVKYCR